MDENSSLKQGADTVSEEVQIAETYQETLEYIERLENKKSKSDK